MESALYESAIKGNLGAQVFFLKNRASDRWRDRTEIDQNVRTVPTRELTDEELKRAVEEG